ncbi:GAF domain-containing protein [Luteolibacter flavescens]|uniref:GAF domain-containing protein n=1 Tax=Luteolibacter flavescens TaxID=1859460 RepID=A0ABT3FRI6_9BACT|nr:GAF domain-containing protein [Luteolibacter flavescens]MCW1886193.1 GAF domain-containing protein [Luteolibacter flavescens]
MELPACSNTDRLEALRRYDILDSPKEEEFEKLVRLVTELFDVPIAAISFVDEHRQWFKAEVGLYCRETPLTCSICAHAVESGKELFVVRDASCDLRTTVNPAVTGSPHIRFYAGAVMRSPDGHALGTLLIVDRKPRELTEVEGRLLRTLARHVVLLVEARLGTSAAGN